MMKSLSLIKSLKKEIHDFVSSGSEQENKAPEVRKKKESTFGEIGDSSNQSSCFACCSQYLIGLVSFVDATAHSMRD